MIKLRINKKEVAKVTFEDGSEMEFPSDTNKIFLAVENDFENDVIKLSGDTSHMNIISGKNIISGNTVIRSGGDFHLGDK